jgi:hypothetical protein
MRCRGSGFRRPQEHASKLPAIRDLRRFLGVVGMQFANIVVGKSSVYPTTMTQAAPIAVLNEE